MRDRTSAFPLPADRSLPRAEGGIATPGCHDRGVRSVARMIRRALRHVGSLSRCEKPHSRAASFQRRPLLARRTTGRAAVSFHTPRSSIDEGTIGRVAAGAAANFLHVRAGRTPRACSSQLGHGPLRDRTVAVLTIAPRSDRRGALSVAERGSLLVLALFTALGIATAFGVMGRFA
jgi:hypothetical protein